MKENPLREMMLKHRELNSPKNYNITDKKIQEIRENYIRF